MKCERLCPLCSRVIIDRTGNRCPNFRSHVAACEKRQKAVQTCEFCGCGLTPKTREQANEIAEARLADGKDCPYICCPGCAEALEPTPPVEWEP